MTRHWTINGRFLSKPITGVQRYAREIVTALDRLIVEGHPLAHDLKVEILSPRGATHDLELERIDLRTVGRGSGYVWEQLELPAYARGGLLSLCNVGPLMAKKHVLCIHDVNTFLSPASYSWKFRASYRLLLPTLGRMAAKIVTVSQFSAAKIAEFGIAPRNEITVISNGREHALRWSPQHSSATRSVAGESTIVVIGSPAPHKNVAMLLGLTEELAAAGLKLAIVGSLDAKVFAPSGEGCVGSGARWLGRLTDHEMAALLKGCMCLAVPSLTEGFGLPALEAMTLGCPVVASDRASLPEICADAALYAPPDEPRRWLAHFLELKRDNGTRSELRRRGVRASQQYSWSKSGERFLEVLAEIDNVAIAREPERTERRIDVVTSPPPAVAVSG